MSMCLGMDVQWPILAMLLVLAGFSAASAQTSGAADVPKDQEIRRGLPLKPAEGKTRSQLFYERIITPIEPDLVGKPDRLSQYIQHFQRAALNDARLIAFDVQANWDPKAGAVLLTGFVEYQEHQEALQTYLGLLGFESVDDQTELMPAEALGELRFGVVRAEGSFLFKRPDAESESLTQLRRGDPVFLLRPADDGFFLCHGWEGYVGYISGQDIDRIDAQGFSSVMPQPDPGKSAATIDPAIEVGMALAGTPYKWGGTTDAGIDCSGLMQHAFSTVGLLLPRDTDQQALVGRLTATRWHREEMRRGDLVFFMNSRGRINHTGVYLGDGKMLESGGPGVRVLSFNPEDPDYNEKRDRRFCFAKRVIE